MAQTKTNASFLPPIQLSGVPSEAAMKTAILPLEVLDHILHFLDDDHSTWSTLEACSEIRNPILRAAIDRRMYTR